MKFVMLPNITDEKTLSQQVYLAREILSVLDIVEPGLTWRWTRWPTWSWTK